MRGAEEKMVKDKKHPLGAGRNITISPTSNLLFFCAGKYSARCHLAMDLPAAEMLKTPLDAVQKLFEAGQKDACDTSLHDRVTTLFRNAIYSKDFGCLQSKTELVPTINSYKKQELWEIPPNSIVRVSVTDAYMCVYVFVSKRRPNVSRSDTSGWCKMQWGLSTTHQHAVSKTLEMVFVV